jgi:putative tricarboxylic transport membrane protein
VLLRFLERKLINSGDNVIEWRPDRPIQLIAGTPIGGGLDRTARALANAIEQSNLLPVPIEIINIPGDGARKAWKYLDQHPDNGHVIAISSSNLLTDSLTGIATFNEWTYPPLAILATEYLAFITSVNSNIRTGQDFLVQLSPTTQINIGLSTARGNPNHIALAQLIKNVGGDLNGPQVRVFDTALDVVSDVIEGNADVGIITAASAVKALSARQINAIAVSAPNRLSGVYADTPSWVEQSVDCRIGAWRGVSGTPNLSLDKQIYWQELLKKTITTQVWKDSLTETLSIDTFKFAAPLKAHLEEERNSMRIILEELGFNNAPDDEI